MKRFQGLLTFLLILSMVFCGTSVGFMDGGKDGGSGSDDRHVESSSGGSSSSTAVESGDDKGLKDIVRVEHRDQKSLDNALRKDLDSYMDDLKDELKAYELLYKKTQLNLSTGSALGIGQDPVLNRIQEVKKELQQARLEIRDRIRAGYTAEQLANIEAIKLELKALAPDVKVLDVDSIIKDGGDLKFDVPPIIKGGRTLIPARAISEGFGASVQWDSVAKTVTITKGTTVIVLFIGQNKALVNGKEVILDSKAEMIGNRTIVPMNFLATELGLKVEWESDSSTIHIHE